MPTGRRPNGVSTDPPSVLCQLTRRQRPTSTSFARLISVSLVLLFNKFGDDRWLRTVHRTHLLRPVPRRWLPTARQPNEPACHYAPVVALTDVGGFVRHYRIVPGVRASYLPAVTPSISPGSTEGSRAGRTYRSPERRVPG